MQDCRLGYTVRRDQHVHVSQFGVIASIMKSSKKELECRRETNVYAVICLDCWALSRYLIVAKLTCTG
jgi:hypothetical protein